MTQMEDCSSVLDQFIHDVANLPAEINHLMEEIQAKDAIIAQCRSTINSRDASLQRFIRLNGSLAPNAKEGAHTKAVNENLNKAITLQEEKVKLAERAAALLDRQVKRLDIKLRDLTRAGLLPNDPPLPTLLVPGQTEPASSRMHAITEAVRTAGVMASLAGVSPTLSMAASAAASGMGPTQRAAVARAASVSAGAAGTALRGASGSPYPASATEATLAAASTSQVTRQQQEAASSSASSGHDAKRRRLASYPAGTVSTASTAAGRAGSVAAVPGGLPGPSTKNTIILKKTGGGPGASGSHKKVAPPSQQNKKTKAGGPGRSHRQSGARGNKLHGAGAGRGRSTPAQSDRDDSALSSPSDSDDELTTMPRASSSVAGHVDTTDRDATIIYHDPTEEPAEAEDLKVYCTCRTISHGDMVACDNEDCPYEWFHWKCVGLTKEPLGAWYCDECKQKLGK